MMKKQAKSAAKTGEKAIKVSVSTVVYAFLIILVVLAGVGSVLAYGTSTEMGEKIATKISTVIPFPAAIVDWSHPVALKDMQSNLASVEKFYQTQNFSQEGLRVDFTTEIGKKRLKIKQREILDKMVEDKVIEILAKKRGISIAQADVDKAVSHKLNEFGTADDVKDDLLNSYGWSMEDFKSRVVKPSMYSDALAKAVLAENSSSDQSAKVKIEQAQKELQGGKDFAEVVRIYSEGFSKDSAGELGWIKKEQVLPQLQDALFSDKALEKNTVVESSIGYHIIEVENRKKEDGVDVFQLRQIFVAKNTFADWLDKQKRQMKVVVPMKEFTWNSSAGSIDFRDPQMQEFERDQRSKAQGDASLLL